MEGDSWKKSSTDIVIAGLGWVAVTGPGKVKIRVTVPQGTQVITRPALMPFEATTTAVGFTGGRLTNRTGGIGWRA